MSKLLTAQGLMAGIVVILPLKLITLWAGPSLKSTAFSQFNILRDGGTWI